MKDPIRIYFGLLKIQVKILDKLKARDFNVISLSTYDFLPLTQFYLIICLQINLLILLKEPSLEKALHTLYVMTETRSLFRKKPLSIMHGLVKMYVMR